MEGPIPEKKCCSEEKLPRSKTVCRDQQPIVICIPLKTLETTIPFFLKQVLYCHFQYHRFSFFGGGGNSWPRMFPGTRKWTLCVHACSFDSELVSAFHWKTYQNSTLLGIFSLFATRSSICNSGLLKEVGKKLSGLVKKLIWWTDTFHGFNLSWVGLSTKATVSPLPLRLFSCTCCALLEDTLRNSPTTLPSAHRTSSF